MEEKTDFERWQDFDCWGIDCSDCKFRITCDEQARRDDSVEETADEA